jgi:hypothetical protein
MSQDIGDFCAPEARIQSAIRQDWAARIRRPQIRAILLRADRWLHFQVCGTRTDSAVWARVLEDGGRHPVPSFTFVFGETWVLSIERHDSPEVQPSLDLDHQFGQTAKKSLRLMLGWINFSQLRGLPTLVYRYGEGAVEFLEYG